MCLLSSWNEAGKIGSIWRKGREGVPEDDGVPLPRAKLRAGDGQANSK